MTFSRVKLIKNIARKTYEDDSECDTLKKIRRIKIILSISLLISSMIIMTYWFSFNTLVCFIIIPGVVFSIINKLIEWTFFT